MDDIDDSIWGYNTNNTDRDCTIEDFKTAPIRYETDLLHYQYGSRYNIDSLIGSAG